MGGGGHGGGLAGSFIRHVKQLLALPQNETHVETLQCIVPHLRSRGIEVRALDLDGIFQQGIDLSRIDDVRVSVVDYRMAVPFYRSSALTQVRAVRALASRIVRHAEGADIILAFNDGAVQRVALDDGRRHGRRTALLIDGIISNYRERIPYSRRALRQAGRVLNRTRLASFLPSEIGMSPVDQIFVIGPHSADVLRSRGAPAGEIIATGLPRFPQEEPIAPRGTVRQLLYLTGAYGWHGAEHLDAAQVDDVRALKRLSDEIGSRLVVRVHPRDDLAAYGAHVDAIHTADRPIREDIGNSDVVISIASTGLLEAIALGRVAMTWTINAPWSVFADSFAADPALGALRTRVELHSALTALDDRNQYVSTLKEQRAAYKRYALPGGSRASSAIAAHLAA